MSTVTIKTKKKQIYVTAKGSTQVHIGKLIRTRLEEVGLTKSEFARRINVSPQNIYGIFKRVSCDSKLLNDIGKVLNYDFFQYYTGQVSNGITVDSLLKDNAELMVTVKRMTEEHAHLKEICNLQKDKISRLEMELSANSKGGKG